ncbi:type II toxin-antitoxin system ParD family antitoxin [Phaeobacter inhibens]|uniref:type II toxin-antitoxin system ParD family antitoxin n=1 Tax=Phaeobacter inhibens TaxID=221822 RepID=UPI0021A87989|nr:type II toxin-antitoxin system ParD family antitoxin [Phaeobacter inhibens]UWR87819.1 type II toxin-antitoxin system ParD family antitoxin [Phaeobacter inhibens]
METIDIALPDPMKAWVETQTEEGRYSDTSDYVQHLIRRDQTRQQALNILQTAVTEGIESGLDGPFDMETFKARLHKTHADV